MLLRKNAVKSCIYVSFFLSDGGKMRNNYFHVSVVQSSFGNEKNSNDIRDMKFVYVHVFGSLVRLFKYNQSIVIYF